MKKHGCKHSQPQRASFTWHNCPSGRSWNMTPAEAVSFADTAWIFYFGCCFNYSLGFSGLQGGIRYRERAEKTSDTVDGTVLKAPTGSGDALLWNAKNQQITPHIKDAIRKSSPLLIDIPLSFTIPSNNILLYPYQCLSLYSDILKLRRVVFFFCGFRCTKKIFRIIRIHILGTNASSAIS